MLGRYCKDETGATAIEYGLIIALIFVAIVYAITSLGANTSNMFNNVATEVETAS